MERSFLAKWHYSLFLSQSVQARKKRRAIDGLYPHFWPPTFVLKICCLPLLIFLNILQNFLPLKFQFSSKCILKVQIEYAWLCHLKSAIIRSTWLSTVYVLLVLLLIGTFEKLFCRRKKSSYHHACGKLQYVLCSNDSLSTAVSPGLMCGNILTASNQKNSLKFFPL